MAAKEFSTKTTFKFVCIALTAAFAISTAPAQSVNTAEALKEYLDSQPVNTRDNPITVAMNVNELLFDKIPAVIRSAGKYVILDLSPSPITTFPDSAFDGCTSLANIIIPNSVTSIGGGAFSGCASLASITIPNSVTSVENNAFSGCPGPGGGKIFYYSKAGFTMTDNNQVCHYLEAAPSNMPAELAWASSGYTRISISGTGTAIGAGRKNTALILAVDAAAPAAKACKDYSNGGKTDWFLPSIDELDMLYESRNFVGNMGTAWYWSSSQRGSFNAWPHLFGNGGQFNDYKNKTYSVRAVRAF